MFVRGTIPVPQFVGLLHEAALTVDWAHTLRMGRREAQAREECTMITGYGLRMMEKHGLHRNVAAESGWLDNAKWDNVFW